MNELTLSYSLADQSFERTKSIGILNLSCRLAEALAASSGLRRFTLLSNRSLARRLQLPQETNILNFDAAANGSLGRILWDQWRCYSVAQRTGNRWLFLPKGFASFLRGPPVKLAAYVHDGMHDYYARHFPEYARGFEQRYFVRSLAATLRHADVIFTNSEFTRSEVRRLAAKAGLPEPRTHVVGIGFSATASDWAAPKENSLVVMVGRWPHKRADLAAAWVQRWQSQSKFSGAIHVVGALPDGVAIPSGGHWHHHARIEDNELNALLRRARALVYFSDYEGFGMPPVEATLAGTCPVYSSLDATREVMGPAGFSFTNDSFDSFHRAMESALTVGSETIEVWRQRLLAEQSWDKVVKRVLDGLQDNKGGADERRRRRYFLVTK